MQFRHVFHSIEAKSLQPEAKEKVANSRVDFRLK
jgi:hypothetical protein